MDKNFKSLVGVLLIVAIIGYFVSAYRFSASTSAAELASLREVTHRQSKIIDMFHKISSDNGTGELNYFERDANSILHPPPNNKETRNKLVKAHTNAHDVKLSIEDDSESKEFEKVSKTHQKVSKSESKSTRSIPKEQQTSRDLVVGLATGVLSDFLVVFCASLRFLSCCI